MQKKVAILADMSAKYPENDSLNGSNLESQDVDDDAVNVRNDEDVKAICTHDDDSEVGNTSASGKEVMA